MPYTIHTARPRLARTGGLLIAILLAGCTVPQDPEGSLERARGGVLRVGAAEAPPWIVRVGDSAAGPESELVRAYAASIAAEVEWRWGAPDAHLHALERFELDLVAAGLTGDSPWKSRVAFTRPWRVEGSRKHVLAVPPGENGALVAVESLIAARREGAR